MLDVIIGNPFLGGATVLFVLYLFLNFVVDHFLVKTSLRKYVLITGCDSGFGYTTALRLSESNCFVYAGCLTQNGVDKLQNDKTFQGMAFIMDVTKDEDVERARNLIEREYGGNLDGVVNNAGIAIHGLIEWQSIELMKKTFEVNYWGTVRVTKVMLPLLKQSHGRIVNVVSIGGRLSPPYTSPYYASKFACEAFSDSLRLELKPWRVSVHVIEPAFYKTDIVNFDNMKKSWDQIYHIQPLHVKEQFSEETMNKFVLDLYKAMVLTKDVGEVAEKIRHALLSRVARRRYITGHLCWVYVFMSHLPTFVQDFIFSVYAPTLVPDALQKKQQ